MKEQCEETLIDRVQLAIPRGRENAISRQRLASLVGTSDRMARRCIEKLRNKGVIILSSTEHPGYWMPETKKEAEEYVESMRSRAISCFNSAKYAREWIRKNEDQLTIGD